jgi:hypothetical protein
MDREIGNGGGDGEDEDDEDDMELSYCEWEGWMRDLDRQGHVERTRMESSLKAESSAKGGGACIIGPPPSSAPSSLSSAESLSRTPLTTSCSALTSTTTADHTLSSTSTSSPSAAAAAPLPHHLSRSSLSIGEGSNMPTTLTHPHYPPIRNIITSTVSIGSEPTHSRQCSSTVTTAGIRLRKEDQSNKHKDTGILEIEQVGSTANTTTTTATTTTYTKGNLSFPNPIYHSPDPSPPISRTTRSDMVVPPSNGVYSSASPCPFCI